MISNGGLKLNIMVLKNWVITLGTLGLGLWFLWYLKRPVGDVEL